jgi:hypothetical protein
MRTALLALSTLTAVACSASPGAPEPGPEPTRSTAAADNADAGTCTSVTLTPGLTSPQDLGTTIGFTAVASCGGATAEYRFSLQRPGGAYVVLQDFSESGAWSWDTTSEVGGAYNVKVAVHAKGAGGSQASDVAAGYMLYGMAVLASGTTEPVGLSVSAVAAYWGDGANAHLWTVPIGGGSLSTLQSGVVVVQTVVDDVNVYAVGAGAYAFPVSGGGPTYLGPVDVSQGGTVALDSTTLYAATSQDAIVKRPWPEVRSRRSRRRSSGPAGSPSLAPRSVGLTRPGRVP